MVDIESAVINYVSAALRSAFSGIYITSEYVPVPSSFPAVSIEEKDNSTYKPTMDIAGKENHSTLMYEINIYSNLSSGKKAECKAIASLIDTKMQEMGFGRVGCNPLELPNADRTKYRMFMRYRCVVDANKAIKKII